VIASGIQYWLLIDLHPQHERALPLKASMACSVTIPSVMAMIDQFYAPTETFLHRYLNHAAMNGLYGAYTGFPASVV